MNKLKEITEVLDRLLGDTEPDIDPDWTDEEIQDEEPLFWCARELNKIVEEDTNA